jgi:hypothetical protein
MCYPRFAHVASCILARSLVVAAPFNPAEAMGRRPLLPPDAAAVARAKDGAARRLADAECQRVFSDFLDARGRTIEENLARWALSPVQYLLILPLSTAGASLDAALRESCSPPCRACPA